MEFNRENLIPLISQYPVLWHVSHKDHYNVNKKNEVLDEIASQFTGGITRKEVFAKWRSLMTYYGKWLCHIFNSTKHQIRSWWLNELSKINNPMSNKQYILFFRNLLTNPTSETIIGICTDQTKMASLRFDRRLPRFSNHQFCQRIKLQPHFGHSFKIGESIGEHRFSERVFRWTKSDRGKTKRDRRRDQSVSQLVAAIVEKTLRRWRTIWRHKIRHHRSHS